MIRRISEELQKDEPVMAALRRVGALPDKVVTVARGAEGVLLGSGGETAEIDLELAATCSSGGCEPAAQVDTAVPVEGIASTSSG